MASKIFTGDLPELMENILNNLKDEIYSLYSCSLVNRHWCRISIPILWQDPFSFNQKPSYISKYFSSLDEEEKIILGEYGINLEISKTIFDYARFLKVLDLFRLEEMVKKWIDFQFGISTSFSNSLSLKYHIFNSLLKIFIENGASLHKFDLNFFENFKIKSEVFCSLGRNEQFFSQLQDLSLRIIPEINTESAITLLKVLVKNAMKIKYLKFEEFYSYDQQVLRALKSIIKSQEQLMQFHLFNSDDEVFESLNGVISTLESQKKSLREFIIELCICNEEFKVLMNCENLEILRLRHCKDMKQLTLTDCKISTLEIINLSIDASEIVLILEKSGKLLQRLKLVSKNSMILEQSLLLKTLKSFCPNITYFEISNYEFSSQFIDFIGSLQKLQFLRLGYLWSMDVITSEKEQIIRFAKILPLTLQCLDLRISYLSSYLCILLKNCYAPLKKLIINNLLYEEQTKAIIEFCIRKRTLNYVGVNMNFKDEFKKEVEKYVKVVPYKRIIVNC
ncbi:hypothetical protein C2G38_2036946 [Gigaspora rosea]|uniref:F-box domain-containing protein n=1 Tax=Gigaspora rosea TaxID=44941 RepID=A0A397V764_9GLOM|nr:hypothetical protein C2G38_2036946 [Gigaspora rosea]